MVFLLFKIVFNTDMGVAKCLTTYFYTYFRGRSGGWFWEIHFRLCRALNYIGNANTTNIICYSYGV